MTAVKERRAIIEDDFWPERTPLFTAQFPSYYREPQQVHGRFHIGEEHYTSARQEIIPLREKMGQRTYVKMQLYVREPKLTVTIGVYDPPKHYADQDSVIGKLIGRPTVQGFRERQVGDAQAWYYPADKTIVLWECFFDDRFRQPNLAEDTNMQTLWGSFEKDLITKFPQAATIATPFNDPIARSREEYQAFLKTLDYSPFVQGTFGKRIGAPVVNRL
jgi:hypothetical protein